MGNAAEVESAISSLIAPGGLRAMTLFSEWGTGKTYLVQQFFSTEVAKAKLKTAKLSFAYVSLFGAGSVAEIRRRIVVEALKGGHHPILKQTTFLGRIFPDKGGACGVSIDLSKLGGLASEYVQDHVTQNLFVCFDDLERASNLSVQDVLGLVAELTEQRDCKCLLVFNRKKLTDDQSKALVVNEEKVFDLNVQYQPSVADNLLHGFVDPKDRELAGRAFESFKNANIRIMKRTAWVLKELREKGAHEPNIWPLLVQHAAILTILKHAYSADVPTLEDAVNETSEVARLFGKEGDASRFPEGIRSRLDELQFANEPYDAVIIRLLESGAVRKSDVDDAAKEACKKAKKTNVQLELQDIWDELRSGFIKDQTTFTTHLSKFVAGPTDDISRAQLAEVCDLLLEVDPSSANRQLVAAKLAPIFRHVTADDRRASLEKFPAILETEVEKLIPYEPKIVERKLADVIADIAGSDTGWDPSGYDTLLKFPDAEIREYFLNLHGERAIFQARHLVERIPGQPPEQSVALHKKLRTVFDAIADQNALHRFQVKYFVRPSK